MAAAAAFCSEMEPAPPPAAAPPAPAAAEPRSAELVCAQGRNLKAVLCLRCGSRVLLPGAATFALRELLLPAMRKKAAAAAGGGGDLVREHWLVRDMFSFENVGFTRDVGNVKFLVCADCEAGPIGWHCLDDKDSFYVALERVAHE
ncbi:guanine nucleotide exchange factor MSS4 [Colius striatus]|uniref:guanine nucleotide exchange factor MSS4 n=1 Tax=Colius striatus TaxID=57412 RepID=UPI002B1D3E50|nr:guanine nucleotide exchange factor MSS4 [Colius striatus]